MSVTTNPAASAGANDATKRHSRQAFARLNSGQRRDLRSEYRFLRTAYRMEPPQAAGVIRRMASMATWR